MHFASIEHFLYDEEQLQQNHRRSIEDLQQNHCTNLNSADDMSATNEIFGNNRKGTF